MTTDLNDKAPLIAQLALEQLQRERDAQPEAHKLLVQEVRQAIAQIRFLTSGPLRRRAPDQIEDLERRARRLEQLMGQTS